MFGPLPQWLLIAFSTKTSSPRVIARAFAGVYHTGPLRCHTSCRPHGPLPTTRRSQTRLTSCRAVETLHKLYSLLGIPSFASKLSGALPSVKLVPTALTTAPPGCPLRAPNYSNLVCMWYHDFYFHLGSSLACELLEGRGLHLSFLWFKLFEQGLVHSRCSIDVCLHFAYCHPTQVF